MEATNDYNNMLEELRHNMTHSIVRFGYIKKNGETRDAMGTLCERIITERGGEMPKGTGETPSETFPYWDVNSEGWRCFKVDKLRYAYNDEVNVGELFK